MNLTDNELLEWRAQMRKDGERVVVTNGCFDILHVGHVRYLKSAKNLGDLLVVGLNSDDSVRSLKGPDRPLNTEADRAEVLLALDCVDLVHLFREQEATRFLSLVQPDIYVKGGDYTIDDLNKNEVEAIRKVGGQILILPLVPGKSTTNLVNKMNK